MLVGGGQRFLDESVAHWANCGKEFFISRAATADEFRLSATITVRPVSVDSTQVSMQTYMTVREEGAVGREVATCASRERLEERFVAELRDRLGTEWIVAWSPDNKTVAFGGWPRWTSYGSVLLLNTDTGRIREETLRELQDVKGLAWSPDGKTLAVGDEEFRHKSDQRINEIRDARRGAPACVDRAAPGYLWSRR